MANKNPIALYSGKLKELQSGDTLPVASIPSLSGVYQPLDATLTALAGANWAANSLAVGSGADTVAQVTFAANTFPARASTGNLVAKTITDFGLSMLDDVDAAAVRTTLGIDSDDAVTFGNLTVNDLTVNGTTMTVNTATITVDDPLIRLADNNGADSVDVGFYGVYVSSGTKYTGFFRDASDGKYRLFHGSGTEPTTTVNIGAGGYAVSTLVANIEGNVTGAVTGNASTATTLATTRAIYGNNFDGSAALTQIIASTYGGTGNGFTKFSGPATAEKTFTLPNASATILTDNAAVTVAQGGTGRATSTTAYGLLAAGTTATGAHQTLAAGATTEMLVGGGAAALPVWTTATGSGSPVRATSPTVASPTFSGTTTILNANGAGYESTISGSVSSPYDILTILSKGGTGGWLGAINFDLSYNAGTVFTGLAIRANADGLTANYSFGGVANRSSGNGYNILNIFNGTAPTGTLTNGASLYVTGGEMRVMDSAGNATLISPHDKDGNWIHDEINYKGRRLRVDMERLVKALDEMLGGGFVQEFLTEK